MCFPRNVFFNSVLLYIAHFNGNIWKRKFGFHANWNFNLFFKFKKYFCFTYLIISYCIFKNNDKKVCNLFGGLGVHLFLFTSNTQGIWGHIVWLFQAQSALQPVGEFQMHFTSILNGPTILQKEDAMKKKDCNWSFYKSVSRNFLNFSCSFCSLCQKSL